MNKLLVSILLILSLYSVADIKNTKTDWVAVLSAPQHSFKVYVDKNSLGTNTETLVNYGIILIVSPVPLKIIVDKKVVEFNAVTRLVAASCSDMTVITVMDYQFNVPGRLPKDDDVSVAVIDYSSKPILNKVDKTNWVYRTLCPSYI